MTSEETQKWLLSLLPPDEMDMRFVLWQNQLWINRTSLVAYFDNEIKRTIDDDMREHLKLIRSRFMSLDPNLAQPLNKGQK